MFKLVDFLKIFLNQFRIRKLHPSQLRALYLLWDQYFPQLITFTLWQLRMARLKWYSLNLT